MKNNFLVFTFILFCSLLNSQADMATFSNPGIFTDGTCNSESPSTIFSIDMDITYQLEPGGDYIVYLVDCDNQVLDVLLFNSAQNNTQYFAVYEDPVCGPFKIFATNDLPDLLTGETFTGEEIGPFEFDPNALDSDCPKENNSIYQIICVDGVECGGVPEELLDNQGINALPEIFECEIENVVAAQTMRAGPELHGWGAFSDPRFGQIVGDDFIATETGFVDEICFYGAYAYGDWMPDGDDNFSITYFDNMKFEHEGEITVYDVPGNIIGGPFSISTGDNLIREKAPFLNSPFGYTAKHDPVAITSGEKYWVSIFNEADDTHRWVWIVSKDFIEEFSTLEWIPPRRPLGKFWPATFSPRCVGCEGLMFTVGYADIAIPTLSEWGIIVLFLLIVVFGSIMIKQIFVNNNTTEILHE